MVTSPHKNTIPASMASAWSLEALEAFPPDYLRELAAKHGLPTLFDIDFGDAGELRAAVLELHAATPCAIPEEPFGEDGAVPEVAYAPSCAPADAPKATPKGAPLSALSATLALRSLERLERLFQPRRVPRLCCGGEERRADSPSARGSAAVASPPSRVPAVAAPQRAAATSASAAASLEGLGTRRQRGTEEPLSSAGGFEGGGPY